MVTLNVIVSLTIGIATGMTIIALSPSLIAGSIVGISLAVFAISK